MNVLNCIPFAEASYGLARQVRSSIDIRPEPIARQATLADRVKGLLHLQGRIHPFICHRMLHAENVISVGIDWLAYAACHVMFERGLERRIVILAQDPGREIDGRTTGDGPVSGRSPIFTGRV